jgi:hypothetical protein
LRALIFPSGFDFLVFACTFVNFFEIGFFAAVVVAVFFADMVVLLS